MASSQQTPIPPPDDNITSAKHGTPSVRVIVVKKNADGWVFYLTCFFILIGGAAFVAAIVFDGDNSAKDNKIALATASEKTFSLPEIIPNPEKDGERPPPTDSVVEDESAFFFSSDDDEYEAPKPKPKPDPKAKPAKPEPEFKPNTPENRKKYLVTKNVTNRLTSLRKIPQDRTVDVLCLFTAQYKNGYAAGKGPKLLERVNYMFNLANDVYKRGGANCAIRLVGLVEADYFDSDRKHDLNNLRSNRIKSVAGYNVAQLRQKTGADLVCLLGTKGGGGLAQCPGAFSVVKRGRNILTHEIQHNFGWKHGMQKPKGGGDDVSIMLHTTPRLVAWMPRKIPDNTVYLEYLTRNK
ncbi:MAG: hypothetical protein LBS59_07870 [Puniceicoccales bacterium]|nr:hypothetical protein [Puniceicoccales bacterium]